MLSLVVMFTRFDRAAWLLVAVFVPACGGGGDLPSEWNDASHLQVNGSQCIGAPGGEPTQLTVTARESGRVELTFRTTLFRCGQEACAYLIDKGSTAKVLVQPCEMHPAVVDKCACTTKVTVELDAGGASVVELWLRPDDYGQGGPNPPRLLDTASLESMCPGPNPSQRCRTSAQDCLPSTCACSERGWLCTADCGGGRLCTDGGGSPTLVPDPRP